MSDPFRCDYAEYRALTGAPDWECPDPAETFYVFGRELGLGTYGAGIHGRRCRAHAYKEAGVGATVMDLAEYLAYLVHDA